MAAALFIDDEKPILEGARRAAETRGLNLVTANSWEEGLALFHVLGPNLVIADYNMPGSRHGLQLLGEIGRRRPSVRLILISGYLSAQDMETVVARSLVDAALTKDGSTATLVDEIADAAMRADEPTDWTAYATAFLQRQAVADEDLDAVDALFKDKVERQAEEDNLES